MTHNYPDNPVFCDFETRSAFDLKGGGGRLYAECPSTQVLSLSCLLDRRLIIWLPGFTGAIPAIQMPKAYADLYDSFTVETGAELPAAVSAAVTAGRTFVAHNAAGFDAHIWRECVTRRGLGPEPQRWGDTVYLARIAGLAIAKLEDVAQRLIGASKDSASRIVLPLTRGRWVTTTQYYPTGEVGEDGTAVLEARTVRVAEYPTLLPGMIEPLCRYCCVDTLILSKLWEEFADIFVEIDVIQAHQNINDRGLAVDLTLAKKLSDVAAVAARKAATEIEKLTAFTPAELAAASTRKGWNGRTSHLYGDRPGAVANPKTGKLADADKGNLRSTPQVHAWLLSKGVKITVKDMRTGGVKHTLRKDVVEQHIANPLLMLDANAPISLQLVKDINDIAPEVFRVLKLRGAATRITSAKTEKMALRAGRDGRIRDLFTYHKAHTGRWSSQGVQVHNLPRGKAGVDVPYLLECHEDGTWGDDPEAAYDLIDASIPRDGNGVPVVTVDDAVSACVRPCIVAPAGKVLCIADYMAVECRGLHWIVDNEEKLAIFRKNGDIYLDLISKVLGRTLNKKDHKEERKLGKVIELGLGYGMGEDKFAITCALSGVKLSAFGLTAGRIIDAWRTANPLIAGTYSGSRDGMTFRKGGLWRDLETAAKNAVILGGVHHAGKCAWVYAGRSLRCTLPSGRELRYLNCRIEDRVPSFISTYGLETRSRPTLVYDGEYGEKVLYGGLICENVVQATCRDLIASAMVRLEGASDAALRFFAEHGELVCTPDLNPPVGSVHDELLTETDAERQADALRSLVVAMSSVPDWARGFPIGVEGYTARRYVKVAPKDAVALEAISGSIH